MSNPSTRKSLIVILLVSTLVVFGTYFISILARGYQVNLKNGSLQATGIISANSKPKGASVYLNDRLVTATDDTLNLTPGDYQIKIVKDGYLPWQKNVQIKKELVYQTETQLFRSVPDLKPITVTGAINPTISPDFTKIVFSVASASATKDNGLYLIELTDNPINISRNTPRLISTNYPNVDWSKFTFSFSPNSRQVLAFNKTTNINYLLNIDNQITSNNLSDVTTRLNLIKEDWNNQKQQLIASKLDQVPKALQTLVSTDSAQSISVTADDKVLYLAKVDGNLPDHIITPPPTQSTQTQSRNIKKGNYYVYDIKDDTNFLIGASTNITSPFWLPNSNSIIFVEGQNINTIDYDGTNKLTLFGGNFDKNSVYPWSDGSRIITLTSPYTNAPANLYAISIR
jgi:hypothetical protein